MHGLGMSLTSAAPSYTEQNEAHLVAASKRGDQDAFAQLVQHHQRRVFNLVFRMVQQYEEANEVTQETFLAAWQGLPAFRGDARFSTWLYRVAVNLCISELRRRSRSRLQYLDELAVPEEDRDASDMPSPDEAAETQERCRAVRRILAALPHDYRAIMVLRHFQQLAYEEIADVLQISLSQVKTRLFRARKMFKDRYEIFMGEESALLAD